MLNPFRVSLRCSNGHQHIYNLDSPGELECRANSCTAMMNSSRVFRGTHPHLVWTNDKFQDESGYIETFTVIPLTSKTTFAGLPTTYPIASTTRNGLSVKSYALVHQICTVDGHCFKDSSGDWQQRMGQLDLKGKAGVSERLKFLLGLDNEPSEDWFKQNVTPELIEKIYGYLPDSEKLNLLESLLEASE